MNKGDLKKITHQFISNKFSENDNKWNIQDSGDLVELIFESIAEGIKEEGMASFLGFGTFKLVFRKARKGKNPKTGEEIEIAAYNSVKFALSKKLKDSLNDK